jgi:AcrR family transcriptional regulator
VLDLALDRYLRGERVEVVALAKELGLARATIYRWFGSREGLLGEVVLAAARPVLARSRRTAEGKGAAVLLDTFDRFNRALARSSALGVICAAYGIVTPGLGDEIAALIDDEVSSGSYRPRLEPHVMAHAVVKLAEAFLFNHGGVSMRGDVEGLRTVEAALLGLESA